MIKAIVNGEKILCGRCMNVLAIHKKGKSKLEWTKKHIKETFTIEPETLEIKCKARKNGINCNEVNQIEL